MGKSKPRTVEGRGAEEIRRVYASVQACYQALFEFAKKEVDLDAIHYVPTVNYISGLNNWIHRTGYIMSKTTVTNYSRNEERESYFTTARTIQWACDLGPVKIAQTADGKSRREAENRVCFKIFKVVSDLFPRVQVDQERTKEYNQDVSWWDYLYEKWEYCVKRARYKMWGLPMVTDPPDYLRDLPMVQMDEPTEQGEVTQKSDKQENTIITRDAAESVSSHVTSLDKVQNVASTEPPALFPSLTSRWMPLNTVKVSTSATTGQVVGFYELPEGLYSNTCAPNVVPFEAYIYGRMAFEIRFVVNANKFCCGKLLVSSKPDPYQAETVNDSVQAALCRNHGILDLSTNNEVLLKVPWRYHRPYVRLVKNDNASLGVRPGKCTSITVQVLSPLQTGKDGASEIYLRGYYRLVDAEFAGMSYRVSVQMDVESVIATVGSMALKQVLTRVEKQIDQLGQSRAQDKPADLRAQAVVPMPRLNFCGGKGPTIVAPLRVNPFTATNYANVHPISEEPSNMYELARIPGMLGGFDWNKKNDVGAVLYEKVVDPSIRFYDKDYEGALTPLEYACSNFAFWSGAIEFRFDFVSNAFHTGTVQISAEFGRLSKATSECESSSTYTKNFHLGDQKSVTFTVPYIYDTIMRRTTASYFPVQQQFTATDPTKDVALMIAPESRTRIKVRVMNALRPAEAAPTEIKVLVFMRAGENFVMHGLKGCSAVPNNNVIAMDSFPRDGYKVEETAMFTARMAKQVSEAAKPIVEWSKTRHSTHRKKFKTRLAKEKKAVAAASTNGLNQWMEHRPVVQMDGESEMQDKTADFRSGKCALPEQTLDCHMDFLDLLKRPTLLVDNYEINADLKYAGFFIPLMPPSRDMCTSNTLETNSIWARSLKITTAVNIMNMFRAWRGSMRYTILITGQRDPVYISLIPHSGTRIVGYHEVFPQAGENVPIYGGNFNTELLLPTTNCSTVVEAPYDTENTWTLTFDEDAQRNYSWRDKGDTNAGHLVISVPNKCKVTVWWSAGDDFAISMFYGIPKTLMNDWAYRWSDAHGRVQARVATEPDGTESTKTAVAALQASSTVLPYTQMDEPSGFSCLDTITNVTGVPMTKTVLQNAMLASIPVVGTPLVAAKTMHALSEKCNETQHHVHATLGRLDKLADQAGVTLTQLTETLQSTVSSLGDKITHLVGGATLLYDFLLDILIAWFEQSWTVVGLAIVRVFSKVFLSGKIIADLTSFAFRIGNYIKDLVVAGTPMVQVDANPVAVLTSIFLGIVGTVTGVVLDTRRTRPIPRELVQRMTTTSGVSYFVQILNFVTRTFTTLRDFVMEALGYVSPEAQALRLLGTQNKSLEEFITEAQIITSEANMNLIGNPRYRLRVWKTVLQAQQIQRMIARVPPNAVSHQLAKLCVDVVKFGNEKFLDLAASPVRYEPMVIAISGPPGTGKSHMTEHLVHELLSSIGYASPSVQNIYYRIAGEKFWSGYRDQPVVVYDEWLNTTSSEKNISSLEEFMKLKSTSLFIPEMAHLEEKKIHGNPVLVIMLCNNAFPQNLADYVTSPEAILRRRDLVLRCTRSEEYAATDLRAATGAEYTALQGPTKPHLQFQIYSSSKDQNSLVPHKCSYTQTLEFLKSRFVNYHQREQMMVKRRMDMLPHLAEIVGNDLIAQDPFTLFYGISERLQEDPTLNQNAWTPYERMMASVEMTNAAITSRVNVPSPSDTLEAPMTWEQAATLPAPQGWDYVLPTVLSVGGLLWGLRLKRVWRACATTLERWSTEILPMKTEMKTCTVCANETPCAYVCAGSRTVENPHVLCAACWQGWTAVGRRTCPTCRSTQMEPLIGPEDIENLTLIWRTGFQALKGTQWIVDRVLDYFRWSEVHGYRAVIVDYFINSIVFSVMGPEFANGAILGSCFMTFNRMAMHWSPSIVQWDTDPAVQGDVWHDAVVTQVHPWDVVEEPGIDQPLQGAPELDVTLNEAEFERCVTQTQPMPVCLHGMLEQNRSALQLTGDSWIFIEPNTRRRVLVPTTLCNTCQITRNTYLGICSHWKLLNATEMRNRLIDYINQPSTQHRENIPPLFRPTWAEAAEPLLVTTSWWDFLSDRWAAYKQFFLYAGCVTAVLVSLLGVYKVACLFTGEQVQAQAGMVGSPEQNPRHRRPDTSIRRVRPQQDDQNPSPFSTAQRNIVRNMVVLNVQGDKQRKMIGIGLFNHTCILPRHYVTFIRKAVGQGMKLYVWPFEQPQLKFELQLTPDLFVEHESTDLAILHLSAKFPLFKDIRKFLMTDAELLGSLPSTGRLLAGPKNGVDYIREIEVDIEGVVPSQVIVDTDLSTFTLREIIKYNFSQMGVCGAILMRENSTRPIMAMHVAGAGEDFRGDGYAVPLTKELVQGLADKEVVVQLEDIEYGTIADAKFVYDETVHIGYLGSLPPEKVPYIPTKSKLTKSAIFGTEELETDMEPAILLKADPRYVHESTPLYAGVRSHGLVTEDFTPEEISRAADQLWDGWYSKLKPVFCNVQRLTVEEAVCGKKHQFYKGMDLSTSAGYPYNLGEKKTKGDYIECVKDQNGQNIGVKGLHPQLQQDLSDNEAKRRAGIIPHTLFLDTLKDEKRPRAKARAEGGTRVFCNAPLENVIATRQNFLHFIAAFMEARHELQHAVGINPMSDEWTRLVTRLKAVGDNIVTIDYKNFGAGYNSSVAKAAYEIMIKWTLEHVRNVNEVELRVLVWECIQSLHVCNNTVYQQYSGSPSGAVFTTVINTMVNQLYLLIAWNALTAKTTLDQIASLSRWKQDVVLYAYGDDAILAVHSESLEMFNGRTITDFFAKYNIVATDATKTADMVSCVPLEEAQFLKRGFLKHPTRRGKWLSPLVERSLKSCTQWVWKSANLEEATHVNCNAALLQAHGHGPGFYENFKQVVNKALIKAKIAPVTLRWKDIDKMFFDVGLDMILDDLINVV